MRLIGNILWFLFGGFLLGLSWFFAGILWCVTIIGIPWGLQCFKFAKLTFWPFGKDIQYGGGARPSPGKAAGRPPHVRAKSRCPPKRQRQGKQRGRPSLLSGMAVGRR